MAHPGQTGEPSAEIAEDRLVACLDALRSAHGLLLAVSGGPDSVALMHLAARWRRGGGPTIAVASVNHGLRREAAGEADDVVAVANRLGFEARRLDWIGLKPRSGIAAKARAARYDLLAAHAHAIGASHLVTAHTRDDQAETVLLRMARGSGLTGLAAMRTVTPLGDLTLARPLLGVPKAELADLCRARGWRFVEDPGNRDQASARARWRAMSATLAREGLSTERLAILAARMARADEALARTAVAVEAAAALPRAAACRRYDMGALAAHPGEIIIRVLGLVLSAAGGSNRPKLERLERLTDELVQAVRRRSSLRRTLNRCLITLDRRSVLSVEPEDERRRGTRSTTPATFHPGSLGKGTHASYIASVDAPARQPDVVETHCTSEAKARAVMLSAGWQ